MGIKTTTRHQFKSSTKVVANYPINYRNNGGMIYVDSAVPVDLDLLANLLPAGFSCDVLQVSEGTATINPAPGIDIIGGTLSTTNAGDRLNVFCVEPNNFAVTLFGGTGGGGVPTTPWVLFAAPQKIISVPADSFVSNILLKHKNTVSGLNFKIGYAPGGDEILAGVISAGNIFPVNVFTYFKEQTDIYFTTGFDGEIKILYNK